MMFTFYPFLEEVWTTYNGFDNAVLDDEDNSKYSILCNQIIKQSEGGLSNHADICMKLMKNLGYFSVDQKFYRITRERCNILFNWIYKLINEKKITDNVINKCFEMYDSQMSGMGNKIKCYFYSNIKIHEPINITLLDIFNDKISTIESTLMDRDILISARGRKYVCECIKIYKHMNDLYCINGRGIDDDYSKTCLKLKQFKESYNRYLYNNRKLSNIIPSLDNIDNDLSDKCREQEKRLQLGSDVGETKESYSGYSSSADTEEQRIFSGDDRTITLGNVDSPMKKTITTTIGTVAGASSLLAFLYKFTPAGRLVNPKLRRNTGIINNNFYGEEANRMLFDGNEHNGFNSYSIGYEAI
ncbi:PIR protein [Plasmodium vivax]|nr:PIR protein [Plasmodium vivax]